MNSVFLPLFYKWLTFFFRLVIIKALPTEGEDASEVRFRHITEMTILTVQLIVEFSKRLPGFDKLEREDQITLLKVCARY